MPRLSFADIAADAELPDAADMVDACAEMASAGQPDGLSDLLAEMGAPVGDMVVTPLSARAAVLAARQGRAFFHHELRQRVPVPADQAPELAVWDGSKTVPTWQEGVLEEPKYFSFFLDQPFPAFNPNYRRKWRPHELLHGALRFFWHPEMTRFEMYVGSRLNELLPVVHWYGFDEIFRPRCPEHRGEVMYREYCQACEDAARPYWDMSAHWRAERRNQALTWARRGLDHFRDEWDACRAEIDTGEVHAVDRPRLDASSDAIGYMRSHWNRMTAWSFGVWAETFLEDGVDYFSSLQTYADHLARTTSQLLSGDLHVDTQTYVRRRGRRVIQDIAYRIYLALGWGDVSSADLREAENRLMPRLEQAAHHVHHLDDRVEMAEYSPDVASGLLRAFDGVRDCFPDEVSRAVPALGYRWWAPERFAVAGQVSVQQGLSQGTPLAVERLGDQMGQVGKDFALSDEFDARGRLAGRFARWLATQPGAAGDAGDLPIDELARFEGWASAAPLKDQQAELFGCLPSSLEEYALRPGRTRLHETLDRASFPAAVIAEVTDETPDAAETVQMARIHMRGELRLIVVDAATAAIFDAIQADEPRRQWVARANSDSLARLLEYGFVVWLPRPA